MLPPTRRELGSMALAGTTALAISGLVQSRHSHAETGEKPAVDQAVEALRRAIPDADEAKLQELVTDQLTYGLWPSGRIQNRFEFINNIAEKKVIYTSMNYSEPSTIIAGSNAIVRHREAVEAHSNEKAWSVEFDVLQVWQKQDNQWKLLARQGWKT